jgi:2-keto-3-deoxy-L-rhamnonate aldolase RhmA
MITVRNHAKERLEAGELALGVGLRQARTVDIAKIMKTAGYDFLFIDMEHNSVLERANIGQISQDIIALADTRRSPCVACCGPRKL